MSAPEPHSLATRIAHMGLALAVVLQLLTSLVMEGPRTTRPGDWLFEIHQYSGLTALAFAALFWLVLALRRRGSAAGLMFPWFSASRRTALWRDMRDHGRDIVALRLPAYAEHGALASAIHGLGLLLMSAMALTGAIFFAALLTGTQGDLLPGLVIDAHRFLANLVWAYLIGHAGVALLYHVTRKLRLTAMWSLRR